MVGRNAKTSTPMRLVKKEVSADELNGNWDRKSGEGGNDARVPKEVETKKKNGAKELPMTCKIKKGLLSPCRV